jgi:hypothetical protein
LIAANSARELQSTENLAASLSGFATTVDAFMQEVRRAGISIVAGLPERLKLTSGDQAMHFPSRILTARDPRRTFKDIPASASPKQPSHVHGESGAAQAARWLA